MQAGGADVGRRSRGRLKDQEQSRAGERTESGAGWSSRRGSTSRQEEQEQADGVGIGAVGEAAGRGSGRGTMTSRRSLKKLRAINKLIWRS